MTLKLRSRRGTRGRFRARATRALCCASPMRRMVAACVLMTREYPAGPRTSAKPSGYHPSVRRLASTFVALLALSAAPAQAEAKQQIVATPPVVAFGKPLTVRGSGWPVIEFCSRKVRISLRTSQNALRIGTATVSTTGRFKFKWVPRRSKVGAGDWLVVARMRCESGKDGSAIQRRAIDLIRIGSPV
jgi:hypothetical protein